jgi:hypothetical protein
VTNATLWISRITTETSEIRDIKFSMRPTVPLLGDVSCPYHANIYRGEEEIPSALPRPRRWKLPQGNNKSMNCNELLLAHAL